MVRRVVVLLAAFTFIATTGVNGAISKQKIHRQCLTVHPNAEKLAEIEQQLASFRQRLEDAGSPLARVTGSVTVPVYFHVINQGAGYENGDIPFSMIEAQLQVLNNTYASSPFRFELVAVSRTTNTAWFTMSQLSPEEQQAKSALRQGGANVLNIYTLNIPSPDPDLDTLGWATFPWDYLSNPDRDGVVLNYRFLPGGTPPNDMGHTATHEVGHWLGLWHTFFLGCNKINDIVADTPAQAYPADNCPVGQPICDGCRDGRDTCTGRRFPGLDPTHNYMDYNDDVCMFEFSTGQSTRMDNMHEQYRDAFYNVTVAVRGEPGQVFSPENKPSFPTTNSGETYTVSYRIGTQLILSYRASGSSLFSGWGRDCRSFRDSLFCYLTVDGPKNVTATFSRNRGGSSATVVNFDVSTSGGPVSGAALAAYLEGFGISYAEGPDTTLIIEAVAPWVKTSSYPNALSSPGGRVISYTFYFDRPVTSLSFQRVGMDAGNSMGSWTATSYSASNEVLGSASENWTTGTSARLIELGGTGIAYVTFTSDHLGWTGTHLKIDDLTFTPIP